MHTAPGLIRVLIRDCRKAIGTVHGAARPADQRESPDRQRTVYCALARSSAHWDDVYHDSHDSAVAGVHKRMWLVSAGWQCRLPATCRSRSVARSVHQKGHLSRRSPTTCRLGRYAPDIPQPAFPPYSARYQKLPSNARVCLVLIPNRECAITSRQGGRQSFDCVF